jgi:hypothetical protein
VRVVSAQHGVWVPRTPTPHATCTYSTPEPSPPRWSGAPRTGPPTPPRKQHREIIEANLAPEGDNAARSPGDPAHDHVVEAGVTELREVAAAEPAQLAEDVVRVPAAGDMTASRVQADRAVAASECATADARPTRRMCQPQPGFCARDAAGEWVLRR